jgi:hypothetical protein
VESPKAIAKYILLTIVSSFWMILNMGRGTKYRSGSLDFFIEPKFLGCLY